MINKNLVIIGGGPAGLAAAKSAYDAGERDIVILERQSELGAYSISVYTTALDCTHSKKS